MSVERQHISLDRLRPFGRDFFGSDDSISHIGDGEIGGKAAGLVIARDMLERHADRLSSPDIALTVPRLVVVPTGIFDAFIERNQLQEKALSGEADDRIALEFQRAELPPEIVGDLRGLVSGIRTPLAVRSSSFLEDALYEPFAGVYATKMIPNNQNDADTRFRRLVEAIKFVYASTWFRNARAYREATGRAAGEEKMAVIIQEVVGERYDKRFYPPISGVARSYNFYAMGRARPDEGVVDLALGLGKTIVDGGIVWTYSPAYPKLAPPVGSPRDLLKLTQNRFWAINMGPAPPHDPIAEAEYLVDCPLADADYDDTLKFTASTYLPENDRIVPGVGRPGARVLNFSRILVGNEIPLNRLIKTLLELGGETVGSDVEIEFALTLDRKSGVPAHFGFLQMRPMVVSSEKIDLPPEALSDERAIVASERVLGNGSIDTISDIVYVDPSNFEAKHTPLIARQLDSLNRELLKDKRPYLLIGFGRWGSSDPWLGTPVEWSQVSGAKAIVEATLPEMNIELSQGSHFFHNLSSFQVCYFSVHHAGAHRIDWDWLKRQHIVHETGLITHVRTAEPLAIRVDGRTGRGVILR